MVFWVKIVSGYMLLLVGLLWLLYRAGSVLHTRQEPPPDSRDLPRGLP
jgi:hypothetical protein